LALGRLVVDTDVHRHMSSPEAAADIGTTVLVVEDDSSLRLLCRLNLELEHYHVLEAGTLTRAEELIATERIDVVLLDLHVAGRHGTELLPLIKAEQPRASICLLSGTSETDPPLQEGVDAFVRKPFDIEDLNSTVRRLSTLALER
jgi:two-component system response regulator HydG